MAQPSHYLRGTPPPLDHVRPESWRDRAACNGHPTLAPSTWDDSIIGLDAGRREDGSARSKRVDTAKAVCRGECPVREVCLADVDLDYDEGVRGGEDIRDLWDASRRAEG